MPDNGRTAHISDLNELRDWIEERVKHLRPKHSKDFRPLQQASHS